MAWLQTMVDKASFIYQIDSLFLEQYSLSATIPLKRSQRNIMRLFARSSLLLRMHPALSRKAIQL